MEQRYQAVLAIVQDGWKISEVSRQLGVSRQAIHSWLVRYAQGRIGGSGGPVAPTQLLPTPDPHRPRGGHL